jgi:hypothetical protein
MRWHDKWQLDGANGCPMTACTGSSTLPKGCHQGCASRHADVASSSVVGCHRGYSHSPR